MSAVHHQVDLLLFRLELAQPHGEAGIEHVGLKTSGT